MSPTSPRPTNRRPYRRFFIWFLPLVWSLVAFIARSHPGDEYGLFLAGSIAGFWSEFIFREAGDVGVIMTRVMIAGAITICAAGWILDLLRVPRRAWFVVWIPLAALIFWITLAGYPTIAKAISKNGSIAAYVCVSLNMSLYVSVILLAIASPLFGWWKRPHPAGCCPQCGYDLRGSVGGRCSECGLSLQ